VEFYYTLDNKFEYTDAAIANTSDTSSFGTPNAVMEIGGDFETLDSEITLHPGTSRVSLEFQPTTDDDVERDEYFIITLVFEVDGETERYRYFVSARS